MSRLPEISLVIPTYNRPKELLRALKSLEDQTLNEFEIVVVDNANDEKLAFLVQDFAMNLKKVKIRYVSEPKLGLHNARHAGVKATCSDILVFTDDDATFHPEWLQAYVGAFKMHPEMVAAGGPVRPMWEVSP
ncbi:MAG: glycosyltransferase family 2 protein, partial [Nitrospira sp.]|nr:glycosyltransferase family 2 protein [Nitrospira sp.]